VSATTIIVLSSDHLEVQSFRTSTIGKSLYSSVIFVSTSVKHDLFYACGQGLFGNSLTNSFRDVSLYAVNWYFLRSSSSECVSLIIVDNLSVDVVAASENSQTWSICNTSNILANTAVSDPPFS